MSSIPPTRSTGGTGPAHTQVARATIAAVTDYTIVIRVPDAALTTLEREWLGNTMRAIAGLRSGERKRSLQRSAVDMIVTHVRRREAGVRIQSVTRRTRTIPGGGA